MRRIPNYTARWPLYLFALFDLLVPVAILYLLHFLFLDPSWVEKYSWLGGLAGLLMLLGMMALRGYSRYRERSIAKKLELVFKVWFVVLIVLMLLAFLFQVADSYSRVVVFLWIVITPLALFLLRLWVSSVCFSMGSHSTKVVFLTPYDFTDFEQARLTKQNVECEAVVTMQGSDWCARLGALNPDYIVMNVALNEQDRNALVKDLTRLELSGVRLIKMEQFMETFLRKCFVDYQSASLDYMQDVRAYSRSNYVLKRLVDISAAMSLLVLVWPVMLYAAWRITRESPGKVFFIQERVGLNGRSFRLFKFRSMHENAHFDPYTQKEDKRIFPFGSVMRKTRIDELPQLWNVLKGDMHFLGPRSEWNILVENYEKDIPFYHERHLVAPGISGWAQVMYPYGSCVEDARQKLMYDLYYIKNWSIWLEIETLLRTVGVVLGKKGL